MPYTNFDETQELLLLKRKLSGIFPESINVVDDLALNETMRQNRELNKDGPSSVYDSVQEANLNATDAGGTFPTADAGGLPYKLSPSDILTLMDSTNDSLAVRRANAWRAFTGRSGTYQRSGSTGLQTALNSMAGTTDDDIQAEVLLRLRKAINLPAGELGHLPLGNMEAFNQWAVTLPHHYIKDVRQAYQNMSDQVGKERVREIAEEKLPFEVRALEHKESLFPGAETLQQQGIAKGEHEASLRPYEIKMKELLEDQKEQEIDAGKAATTITVKIHDKLHHLQWDSDTQAYVAMLGPDGQPVVSKIDRPTNTEQNIQTYIRMENAARTETGQPLLSKAEEAKIMMDFGLKDQVVQGGLSKELPTELFNAQIAFATSSQKMQRMLSQISRSDVAIGGIKGIAKAFSAISGQTKQAVDAMASAAGEMHLLTHPYKFGVAQESVALHSNIIDLAYQLARAADPGGRLSDRDVQSQINRITGSLQNKASFARSLMEVYNQSYERMRLMYQLYNKRGVAGAEEPWETFLGGLNAMGILTGRLEEFEYTTAGGVVKRGVGYKYYDAKGLEQMQPVSEWEVK